jgi:type I restriction enzyme, S subunit
MTFAAFSNARVVRSSWLNEGGRRLDCNPYMSGALEARDALRALSVPKEPLHAVTAGFAGGIFNGPIFSRQWVTEPEFGVPFLSNSDMPNADLSTVPLLRKSYAESRALRHLALARGMTLITCSGTIGRMTYVRDDMAGMWSSQHIMKVAPDPAQIAPGYLYAFLSSKYGVPLVVSGTYGAIIQHIEPEHIAKLPVPRFPRDIELSIAKLVDAAADARSEAVALLKEAERQLIHSLNLVPPTHVDRLPRPDVATISSGQLLDRCDAYYYSARNKEARTAFDGAAPNKSLGSVAEVFIPSIFKRIYASDPQFGSPYITGGDVFELAPTSNRYLMRKVAEQYGLLLRKGMIVIQEAGQLGGLIGRSVMVGDHLDGFSCSNNMIRIVPKDDVDAGYLFSLLNSEYGVRLLTREAAGSSIPHTDEQRVRLIQVPWPARAIRARVSDFAVRARELRDQAAASEDRARALVEKSVGRGD